MKRFFSVRSDLSRRSSLAVLLLLASQALCACYWINTQRWPGPLTPERTPLPKGDADEHRRGPEEVLIVRHADPVQVRPAGFLSGYPLTFYSKRQRVSSGSSVIVSAGGRAEVLWPMGTSIVLFGEGVGIVGSPSRGEPTFSFQEVDRATLNLVAGDQVELVGGAVLSGDSGPYLLEQAYDDVLRVRNLSKGVMTVAFREELFELPPGNLVDLPLLSAGGAPLALDFGSRRVTGPGFSAAVRGDVIRVDDPDGLRLRAEGDHEISALGVEVKLGLGEEVLFTPLRRPGTSSSTVTANQPTSEPANEETTAVANPPR